MNAVEELAKLKARAAEAESELGQALVRLKSGESGLYFEREDDQIVVYVAGMNGGGAPTRLSPVSSALVYESLADLADLLIERAQEKTQGLVRARAEGLAEELAADAKRIRDAEKELKGFLK